MDAEREALEREGVERVLGLLARGPQTTEALAFALDVDGFFRSLEELGVPDVGSDEGRHAHLRDLLLLSEAVWTDEDDDEGLNFRCDRLLDGRVLTHRLTEREVREDVLLSQLETTGHDFGIAPNEHPFGTGVEQHYDMTTREVTWQGPAGWLSQWSPGDLIAIARENGHFRLEAVAPWELGNGRAEIAALTTFADSLTPNVAHDDFDLLPKLFAQDATAFTSPTLPISELVGRAGLEIRDGYYGLAREPWSPPGQLHHERDLDDLVARFALDQEGREALDSVISSWIDLRVTPADALGLDYRAMAENLSRGSVAVAFEAWTIPMGSLDGGPYLDVLVNMAAIAKPSAAGAHFLLARSLIRRGEVLSAVRALERALAADATYWPADVEMASVDFYLGNFDRAKKRLERNRGPDVPDVFDLFPDGSGFDGSQSPFASRRALLAKAHWYLRSDSCRSQVAMAHALAFGADGALRPEGGRPFVADLLLFEGGVLAQFLRAFRPLLPPDELAEAEVLQRSVRQLFEVADMPAAGSIGLHRIADGDTLRTARSDVRAFATPGLHVVARVVSGDGGDRIDGPVLPVDARQRRALIDVLAFARREPSAAMRELLDWFATANSAHSASLNLED